MEALVRVAVGVESKDLENKDGWLKRGEKRQIFAFFVLESSEESAIGVDGRRRSDIIESGT